MVWNTFWSTSRFYTWATVISPILGPLLFNIFLADLLFILSETDLANYADDNTPYTSSSYVNGLIKSLEEASKKSFKSFDEKLKKVILANVIYLLARMNMLKLG